MHLIWADGTEQDAGRLLKPGWRYQQDGDMRFRLPFSLNNRTANRSVHKSKNRFSKTISCCARWNRTPSRRYGRFRHNTWTLVCTAFVLSCSRRCAPPLLNTISGCKQTDGRWVANRQQQILCRRHLTTGLRRRRYMQSASYTFIFPLRCVRIVSTVLYLRGIAVPLSRRHFDSYRSSVTPVLFCSAIF